MSWGFVAGAAVTAIGGAVAADQAGDAAADGADASVAESRRQYDQTRQDMMPWLKTGRVALKHLRNPDQFFKASPDYEFVRNEGQRNLGNSWAAKGGAFSGNALRSLSEFNTNLAKGEFGNWWNRQAGLAGVGQSTATSLGDFGARSASNIGNAYQNAGDARASGIIQGFNSLANGVNQGMNYWAYKKK